METLTSVCRSLVLDCGDRYMQHPMPIEPCFKDFTHLCLLAMSESHQPSTRNFGIDSIRCAIWKFMDVHSRVSYVPFTTKALHHGSAHRRIRMNRPGLLLWSILRCCWTISATIDHYSRWSYRNGTMQSEAGRSDLHSIRLQCTDITAKKRTRRQLCRCRRVLPV
jgi:hypothetical protein